MSLFSNFYGGSGSNAPRKRGRVNAPISRRSGNPQIGGGQIGYGNPNWIKCICPNGGNCGWKRNPSQCARCCRRNGDAFLRSWGG